MDGTTAGSIGLVPLAPLPPASGGGNLLHVDHAMPAVSQPVAPRPLAPIAPVPLAPQFSQTTPIYAPGPTNTVADIPQPAVKGIEFVQAPPIPSGAPIVNQPAIVPQPVAVAPPAPIAPIAPPPPLPPSPQQLIQPVLAQPTAPLKSAPAPIEPTAVATMSGAEKYDNIENHLEDVDLDQTLGATSVPTTPEPVVAVTNPVPVPEQPPVPTPPPATSHEEAVRTYFQNGVQAATDVPVTPTGFSLKNLNLDPTIIRRVLIIVGIVIVLGIGGYFGVKAIMGGQKTSQATTPKTTAQTSTPQPDFTQTDSSGTTADTSGATADSSTAATTTTDTTDTSAAAAATTTTTTTTTPVASDGVPTVANTAVSDDYASLPGYLDISKLSIHAPIEQVGVTAAGSMGVPSNIWDAGWYIGSARPGQTGAAFIDGHSSSAGGALFGKLDTLAVGDSIKVERNDGIVINYTVAHVSVVNRNDVNMASMLQSYNKKKNGLNIMSCEGNWIASESTLENRVLVYAVQT